MWASASCISEASMGEAYAPGALSSRGIRVELLAPPPVFEDELLGLRHHRRIPVDLVLPDRDVLGDARAERVGGVDGSVVTARTGSSEDPADVDVVLVDRRGRREERDGVLYPQHT